ncbi:MAG: sodium-dependent transporter [Spirochaetia bacterium]|jgi:NSS family neurotransmitter:Na+ symporter|nr:sodium-dependent transporter [Spirochaetia bacterium]
MSNQRETLGSRLGFILLSAGCAIGLGNVWRFPYIVGKYGGATFVVIYLAFLLLLGTPIMVMEFAIGRASKQNIGIALRTLEPKGTKWHLYGPIAIIGNYFLMMFYTTITGWLFAYVYHTAAGHLSNLSANQTGAYFTAITASPGPQIFWMSIAVILGFTIVSLGLQRGVEKITKLMMSALIVLMALLAINSCLLKGGAEGLRFYLRPTLAPLRNNGFGTVIFAAMGQAFFTLSLGIGSMEIFGSYIGKDHTLTGESLRVIALDTLVAIVSGLIIFPACSAFGINPGSGPSLLFVTLPNVFNQMNGGRFWGTLFFIFMSFAALSTLIAVFENIISYWIDVRKASRKKACFFNALALISLSLPCVFGFNIWSGFKPFGPGTNILDLEDFFVSTTLLPLGSLIFLLFCCSGKFGWGFNKFVTEADEGKGIKFPKGTRFYLTYFLPIIILVIFLQGYFTTFA